MIRSLIPYPLLTLCLILTWLMLAGLTPGSFLLAVLISLFAAQALRALGEKSPRMKRWRAVPELIAIVLYDILRSNIAVTLIILSGDRRERTSGFITIPLQIRHPFALAVLSIIITSTPGTVWVDYHSARGELTIHVFDLVDEEAWVHLIATRYERLLLEIYP